MKTKNKEMKHATTILFMMICLGGFAWQEYEISKIYFDFDVTTSVQVLVPHEIVAPGLSACFRYTDILNYSQLNVELGTSFNFTLDDDENDKIQQHLHIADIFKYTPEGNDSFSSCRSKVPSKYQIFMGNSSTQCLSMFKVYKFFFVEYMCYRYEYTHKPDLFHFEELSNTPKLSGVIYEIEPGDKFSNYQYGKFMLHTGNVYPARAVGLSPVMFRGVNWQNLSENSANYFLTYFKLQKTRLGPPFKTNCLDYKKVYGAQSRTACRQECIKIRTVAELERIPFTSIVTAPTDMKAITYLDTLNHKIQDELFNIYLFCDQACSRPDCEERTTFNRISEEKSDKLTIQVLPPNEPWVNYYFVPIMTLPEFVTYCLSCFGTWFGLSVLTLNPFAWIFKLRNYIRIMKDNKNDIRNDVSSNINDTSNRRRYSKPNLNVLNSRAVCFSTTARQPLAYDPLIRQKLEFVFQNQQRVEFKVNQIISILNRDIYDN